MKKILILLIGVLIISCNHRNQESSNKAPSELTQEAENFDWLLGEWVRLDEEDGKRTFENWQKNSETEYSGIGFTMQSGDTIKQEKIRLIKANGKWNLTVRTPDETKATIFKMIDHTESEFTCENKEIDFPNKIRYWKNGNKINASVSNAEMVIPFEFEKTNKR